MKTLFRACALVSIFFISGCGETTYHGNYKRTTGYSSQQIPVHPRQHQPTHEQQLAVVRNGRYYRKSILNSEETKLYWALVHRIKGKSLVVLPQVSLGEVLGSESKDEFLAINSKRCDFCIVDQKTFRPLLAIEYYGAGRNYSSNSANNEVRDMIKQSALEIAGVTYLVVRPEDLKDIEAFIDREILKRV